MGSGGEFLAQAALMIKGGGVFMYVILLIFLVGLVIGVVKFLNLFRYDVDGPTLMNEIQKYVLSGDVHGAIKICSGSSGLLPRVLKNGLKRSNQNEQQIQNAIDATAFEVFPKLDSNLNYMSLIANISTLVGLLGTIFGLIQSFQAVAAANPSEKAELLSSGIALAMNTTAGGLISAIIIMAFHAFLTAKAERITNSIDEFSAKLIDLLGTKNTIQKGDS